MKQYILENKVPVEVSIFGDFVKMMAFQESGQMIVKQEYLGDFWVSTVFLGLDHNYHGGSPILFETMIFNKDNYDLEHYQNKCSTYDQAEIMHKEGVRVVEKYCLEKKALAIIKAGALAIATIMLIYSIL